MITTKNQTMKRFSLCTFSALSSLCVLVSTQNTVAQPAPKTYRIGGYLGLNFNVHSPNFPVPKTATQDFSGTISSGETSLQPTLGAIFEYAFSKNFGLDVQLGFNSMSADLNGTNVTGVQSPASKGNMLLETSLSYLEFSPLARLYNVFTLPKLHGIAGISLGIPLSSSYTQTFTTTASQILSANTSIPSPSMRFGLVLGAGYELALSEAVSLSPELTLSIPFGDISSEWKTWSATQIRAGVSLRFSPSAQKNQDSSSSNEGKITLNRPEIGTYDEKGVYVPIRSLKVEETRYSELFPLIPYVFYDKESSQLITNYHQSAFRGESGGEFKPSDLPQDALEINKNTLNIIGGRMQQFPQANLTITGTSDGNETAGIGQNRAESAKNYLVKAFQINPERIKTEGRVLPEQPTAPKIVDGEQENRRVEFSSNVPDVLDPISTQSSTQRLAIPNVVEFRPSVTSTEPIVNSSLVLTQGGRALREFSQNGEAKSIRWVVRPNELSATQVPIEYRYSVVNKSGERKEVSGSLPVDFYSSSRKSSEQLPDKTVEKFSLVLFDFNKSELTTDQQRIVERNIIPFVKFNSVIKVFGYTDRTGDVEYNRQLSLKRAETVKQLIYKLSKPAKIESIGVGKDLLLFENESPIGRQLSRTVQVIIETPSK